MWTHTLDVGHRVIAADIVARSFSIKDDIVVLPIQVWMGIPFKGVRLHSEWRPTVSRTVALPKRVEIVSVRRMGVSIQLIVDVEVL